MIDQPALTPEQIRSARALLQWSQADLAKKAGVAVSTVAEFEKGQRVPIANNVAAILHALQTAGVSVTPGGVSLVQELFLFLISEDNAAEVHLHYSPGGAPAALAILSIFGDVNEDGASIAAEQVATATLKSSLDGLVRQFGAFAPQLNKLKKFIYALKDDEFFLLLPDRETSTAQKLQWERHLHRLNHPDEAVDTDESWDLFDVLLERYDATWPRTDRLTLLGNKSKDDRRCRFCDRTKADGATFKSDAHVIPTALGNDHLKLGDECDECNGHFGRETEPSLIALLDIQRVFLGIQGRGKNNGRPKISFAEGAIFHDGQRVNLQTTAVSEASAPGTFSMNLGNGSVPMIPVSAYKALVKIALCVVNADQLPHLIKTLEWVRYGKHANRKLPTVAAAVVDFPPEPSAQITVYTRKDETSRLPHVIGEFRLGCYLYVFALPLSDRDSWDLVGFFDDADFRDTFKHYVAVERWSQQDLSGQDRVRLSPKIKFVPRDPKP